MSTSTISGFITRRGRRFHTSELCPKYRYGVASARRFGRTVHPRVATTAHPAQARGKQRCTTCGPDVPGAGDPAG